MFITWFRVLAPPVIKLFKKFQQTAICDEGDIDSLIPEVSEQDMKELSFEVENTVDGKQSFDYWKPEEPLGNISDSSENSASIVTNLSMEHTHTLEQDIDMSSSSSEDDYLPKAESSNLSNIEHRAVIKYFVKKGKTPKEIFEDMVSVLQESAPSYTMVKKWARLFQQGRESCEDDPRPGRPVTVVTEENVRKIEKLVLADRRIKLWQIAEELQISKERVGEIIHEHMNMRKISARWVPKMLTPFDKQRGLQTSKDFLELVGDNIDEICDRIVTVDETWVRQYEPKSKQESMQWTKKGERPPKKFKVQKSASKLMATIFWDSEGVLLIDYLPNGTTMNGQYYANLLAQAREAVVQKRRGKLSRGVLFLQDNASVHTARVSRQALKDTGFLEIDHPPYSPDLAPSDYFLFSNLKKELRGRRFVDDNQMKMAVESHFNCKEKEYFLGGLKALYTRYHKEDQIQTTLDVIHAGGTWSGSAMTAFWNFTGAMANFVSAPAPVTYRRKRMSSVDSSDGFEIVDKNDVINGGPFRVHRLLWRKYPYPLQGADRSFRFFFYSDFEDSADYRPFSRD
ncbi:Histone-lysine N-methyltransferase SETMAR [Eumeta japonica]|uniref:Histone-lysine N-methyltransferase SETMAR n=1 Tax=Eumeta variegata TaxID=151549 RepID=A0A4C1UW55_EUMVA|nr:Histone-lysine N-methyltransferase SETMAR [Eumeta japonica]